MTIFGIDVSRHQGGLDLRVVTEVSNVDFVMAKLSEGQGYKDPEFTTYATQAEDTDLLFAAYHFLRGDSAPGDQARNVQEALGGRDIPVIIDIERTNGVPQPKMADARVFRDTARELGVRVSSLLYLPEWYWMEIGRPDTGGWSLWQSAYGLNDGKYPGDDSTRWVAMGRQASILQFTSAGRVNGYSGAVDINAFRGTRAELAEKGWFYDMKEHEVATRAEIQKWVAETPILMNVGTGESLPLQRVLRDLRNSIDALKVPSVAQITQSVVAALPPDVDPTPEAIAQAVVAALPPDNDLTKADVKDALTSIFRHGVG